MMRITTTIVPTQNPALKISPMTSHDAAVTLARSNKRSSQMRISAPTANLNLESTTFEGRKGKCRAFEVPVG